MVVVCDAEDRENEGDLTLAAQFATPENINFMAREARGLICLALTAGALRRARPRPDGGQERVRLRDRLHGLGRGPRGRHDRHLRARPRAHDPGRDRPPLAARGPRPAGPRVPAQGALRRRARAHRPDRGRRRPGAPRGADPGRGDLRDHERRRHDGAGPGPDPVLRAPRPEDDHGRRPDQVPAPDREAGRARRRGGAADRVRRLPRRRLPRRCSTRSTTSRSSRATSRAAAERASP